MSPTKIYLLRHGDRSSGYGDVELSAEGRHQAAQLAENPQLQQIEMIFSSPKSRTQQTVAPLAEKLGLQVQIDAALDQRKSIETSSEFARRAIATLEKIVDQHPQKNLLLCSHSDWLQAAILQLPSDSDDNVLHSFFSCAEFKTLIRKDGRWSIQ